MMTKRKLLWYEYNYLFRVKRCDDVRECSFRIYRYFCYLIQGYHTKQISDTYYFSSNIYCFEKGSSFVYFLIEKFILIFKREFKTYIYCKKFS